MHETSDQETSINFSNHDQVLNYACRRHDRNFERFITADEGGITNQSESCTDNNSEIISFLAGIQGMAQSNTLLGNSAALKKKIKRDQRMVKKESMLVRSAINDLLSQTEGELCDQDQDQYQSQVDALIDDFDFKLLNGLCSKNEDPSPSPVKMKPSVSQQFQSGIKFKEAPYKQTESKFKKNLKVDTEKDLKIGEEIKIEIEQNQV